MIKTKCKSCKFAIYDGNKQVGCDFDRLAKFKSIGVDVTEATDNDNITYNIIDTVCNYCFDKNSYDNTSNAKEKFQKLTQFDTSFIIVDNQNESFLETYNKIVLACHRAIYQAIKPKKLFYILYNNNITAEQKYALYELIIDLLKGTDIEGYFTNSFEENNNYINCVYYILNQINTKYFTIFNAGYNISVDFNFKMNYAINTELRNFICYEGQEKFNGLTINTKIIENPVLRNKTAEEIVSFIKSNLKDLTNERYRLLFIKQDEEL